MDKQREFWKHNINPITGFVYDSKRDSVAIKAYEDRRLKKLGISVKKESFNAEYEPCISSLR